VRTNFWTDFRRLFSRGLAAILPTVLTIALIIWLVQTIDQYIGRFINRWAMSLVARWYHWDQPTIEAFWVDYRLGVVGFVLAIILVYIIGLFMASFIGRTVWRSIERLLTRIPIIRLIYPSIKQITDFLILTENKPQASRVVAVEYPRKGLWSLGLVTSGGIRTLQEATAEALLTVFIPSSPTPVTGYTITVRRDEVIDLPFSIDDALRYIVSGGVIAPPGEVLPVSQSPPAAKCRSLLPGQKESPKAQEATNQAKEKDT